MAARVAGTFVEPMLLLGTDRLPDDASRWAYELKLDGYRAVAFNAGGRLHLQCRNADDFSQRWRSGWIASNESGLRALG